MKTRKQLQEELDAANKRCADLADALVKMIQAQPVYVPYFVPAQPFIYPSPVYVQPVSPFGEPWVITTCSTTDKVLS